MNTLQHNRNRLTAVALTAIAVGTGTAAVADGATQQQLKSLNSKIGATQSKINKRKGKERVLTSDIASFSNRINSLESKIKPLEQRAAVIEVDLSKSQATLNETQAELRKGRARLVRLRARLAEGREVLAARLVDNYTSDRPTLINAIVDSKGFGELLDRAEHMAQISKQDTRIIGVVAAAKTEATGIEKKLSVAEARQRKANETIKARMAEVVTVKDRLEATQGDLSSARAERKQVLSGIKEDREELEGHLQELQKEQSSIQAKLMGVAAGSIKQGSGNLIWPTNGQFTSGFGFRWGRLHGGIDIAVPGGTAVRAADDGTVTIAGWVGGYGNYICISHGNNFSTCYGHNSKLNVSVGQKVSKGQIIAASGNTGNSTGPHVHFETRVGGVQKNPMGWL